MADTLFVPGALPDLQRVELVENDEFKTDKDRNFVDNAGVLLQAKGVEAQKLQSAIFSLPNLSELSGECRLFLLGIPKKWVRWFGIEQASLVQVDCWPTSLEFLSSFGRRLFDSALYPMRKLDSDQQKGLFHSEAV